MAVGCDHGGPAGHDGLVDGVRRRDERAFQALVTRHVDAVHGYLLRMTGNPQEAEDLTQETFLRVWQKAGTYRPGRVRVSTWLHRIAHNLCVDALRRKREVPTATGVLPEQADDRAAPEDERAAREQTERLLAAVDRLPHAQRSALLLCHVQGFSNAEAATIMNVGVRALESLLARARRTLRSALFDNGEFT